MVRFARPASAVAALHAVLGRGIETPEVALLPRAGAHHGRAIAVEGHHYGAAVHLASRVAGLARPGQLLVTSEVARAAQSLGSVTIHLGTRELRNISKPIEVWEVRLEAGPDRSLDVVDEI
jgi:adenylate cyclase